MPIGPGNIPIIPIGPGGGNPRRKPLDVSYEAVLGQQYLLCRRYRVSYTCNSRQ